MSRKTTNSKNTRTVSRKPSGVDGKDAEISRLKALVKKYEERLEIDHCYKNITVDGKWVREKKFLTDEEKLTFPDAIFCRDATIKFLEADLDEHSVIVSKAIDLIYAEMGKSIGWDRELIPNYMKPLFDALDQVGYFIDSQPQSEECQ